MHGNPNRYPKPEQVHTPLTGKTRHEIHISAIEAALKHSYVGTLGGYDEPTRYGEIVCDSRVCIGAFKE